MPETASVEKQTPWPILRKPYIPLTLRKKLGKLYPKYGVGTPFTIPVFDQTYEGRTGNHMDDKIFLYGLHEASTIRLLRKILEWQRNQGLSPEYLDIGTNCGLHLTAVSPLADKAYGFEPWEPVRQRALHNLSLNNLVHVNIFDFGLSDEDATLPFAAPISNNLGVGLFVRDDLKDDPALMNSAEVNMEATIQLQVKNGDAVVSDHNIKPTLLKIDVEGFERKVLEGLASSLHKYRPAVIIEYSDISRKDLDDKSVRDQLFGPGYSYYGILRSREYPKLVSFQPQKKYENVLAWPDQSFPKIV